VSRIHKKSK